MDGTPRACSTLGQYSQLAVRPSGTTEYLERHRSPASKTLILIAKELMPWWGALKRCWRSMWTARIAAYRQQKGFGREDVGIALVEANMAGVMLAVNPMNAGTA